MTPREHVRLMDAPYIRSKAKRWEHVIRKWQRIIRILKSGKRPTNISSESCAFCRYTGDYCIGCPVARDTEYECGGTPWAEFDGGHSRYDYTAALRGAERELVYLKELRKKEMKK